MTRALTARAWARTDLRLAVAEPYPQNVCLAVQHDVQPQGVQRAVRGQVDDPVPAALLRARRLVHEHVGAWRHGRGLLVRGRAQTYD